MKKLATYFKKDPNDLGSVINTVNPDNEWVATTGIATRKYDGTSVAIINGELYKRFDLKRGRTLPPNAIACQDPDEKSGHHPHWVKCVRGDNSSKYHFEAFDILDDKKDGTYELCGEKVQKNPEGIEGHILIEHGVNVIELRSLDFHYLKAFLETADMEGIVFHDTVSDKMCKLRKSDFNIKRK